MSASRRLLSAQAGLSLCLVAFALPPLAAAGDTPVLPGILARDDVYFARRLLEVGYHDLAARVCEALMKSPDSSDAERMGASALLLDVDADKASRDPDPQKRMEVLRANLAARQDFIAKNPDSSATPTLRANMPLTYRLLAEATIAAIKAEKDAGKVAKLEGEAKQLFIDGMKGLIAEVNALEEKRGSTNEAEAASIEQQYVMAKYNLARLRYFRTLLYKPNDLGREQMLADAIEGFQQFALDHNDTLVCFEGEVLQALCEIELGKTDDALLTLDEAIKVRETYEMDAKGRFGMPPETIEIVSSAVTQKMKLLDTLKRSDEALAAADDFLKTTMPDINVDAYYAVKIASIDSLNAAGKADLAQKSAREIMDQDKSGRWAARAREILAKGGGSSSGPSLGVTDLLQLAESQASRGEIDDAIETCRKAIYDPGRQGSKQGGAQALLLLGGLYARKPGFLSEAAAAYDQVAVVAAGTDDAPEGLWRAVNVDMELRALEKKQFYKRRIDERLSRIAREYPKHPAASQAQLIEGRQLETEKRFADAATAYMKVLAGASAYEEAMYRAGYCFLRDGQRLVTEKKDAEAKATLLKSEEFLKKAIDAIAPARLKTLDVNALANLDRISFEARVSLANLYLMEIMAKDKDALALLDGAEADAKGDADKLTSIWRLRIQALQKLGKLDEAEKLLATLMSSQPDSPATGAAAGILARAFDKKATELLAKDPKSKDARALFDKAARYYEASVRPQLASRSFSTTALSEVAERVFALAFILNDLPDSVTSSAGIDPKAIATKSYFESAVRVYKAIFERAPSYRTEVKLARSYGFLGRYEDASNVLAHLFENEPLVDPTTHQIKNPTLKAKPELLLAWVEYGIAESAIGAEQKQSDRTSHALEIFETTCRGVGQDYEAWWHAKLGQIQCLYDLGEYEKADIAFRTVVRTSQDFDGNKYGLRDRFVALGKKIAPKVPNTGGSKPAPPQKGN